MPQTKSCCNVRRLLRDLLRHVRSVVPCLEHCQLLVSTGCGQGTWASPWTSLAFHFMFNMEYNTAWTPGGETAALDKRSVMLSWAS